jgi:hypothetical protein
VKRLIAACIAAIALSACGSLVQCGSGECKGSDDSCYSCSVGSCTSSPSGNCSATNSGGIACCTGGGGGCTYYVSANGCTGYSSVSYCGGSYSTCNAYYQAAVGASCTKILDNCR